MPRSQPLTTFPDPSSRHLADKDLPPEPPRPQTSASVETFTQAQLLQPGGQSAPSGALLEIVDLPAPHSGHIRILQINRPSTCNAISYALLSALRKEIQSIQSQYSQFTGAEMPWTEEDIKGPTRALIIASAVDSSFSSGADMKELKELKEIVPERATGFLLSLRDTFKALSNLPIPTISAISSCALGSGFELALATNFRVMSSDAYVSLPETGLGITPSGGGTHRLSTLIGVSQAREIILTGRRVMGPEAHALGIANRLVDVDTELSEEDELSVRGVARRKVLVEAIRLSEEICEGAPMAVRAVLQALKDPGEKSENAMFERVVVSEDWSEALVAFNEKRNPIFKGR
ncbi:Methylglutaconyl-CoA hydratase, mitochondrial [Cytospora mali]|uniref:Methylglutaconyl-CoA hydratase, mitochondrial n=1 Tax=Cytospora mali TaxID=578113 RepID=A0A194VL02_CYTMA|nr:Methylglutaconyl-CoA hydratase, mitochondrial [Valsa mali]